MSYAVIGDTVNTGSRREGRAPVGGVQIGAETYRRLPDGTVAEPMPGLEVKGKDTPIDAYLLRSLPAQASQPDVARRRRRRMRAVR